MIEERRRRIDLQIETVQASVALLRSTSLSSVIAHRSDSVTLSNHEEIDINKQLEELRSRIMAQEAELEILRKERLRIMDSMDEETLYDESP